MTTNTNQKIPTAADLALRLQALRPDADTATLSPTACRDAMHAIGILRYEALDADALTAILAQMGLEDVPVTYEQIEQFWDEAGRGGDLAAHATCGRALEGSAKDQMAVWSWIRDRAAQQEEN